MAPPSIKTSRSQTSTNLWHDAANSPSGSASPQRRGGASSEAGSSEYSTPLAGVTNKNSLAPGHDPAGAGQSPTARSSAANKNSLDNLFQNQFDPTSNPEAVTAAKGAAAPAAVAKAPQTDAEVVQETVVAKQGLTRAYLHLGLKAAGGIFLMATMGVVAAFFPIGLLMVGPICVFGTQELYKRFTEGLAQLPQLHAERARTAAAFRERFGDASMQEVLSGERSALTSAPAAAAADPGATAVQPDDVDAKQAQLAPGLQSGLSRPSGQGVGVSGPRTPGPRPHSNDVEPASPAAAQQSRGAAASDPHVAASAPPAAASGPLFEDVVVPLQRKVEAFIESKRQFAEQGEHIASEISEAKQRARADFEQAAADHEVQTHYATALIGVLDRLHASVTSPSDDERRQS